MPRYRFDDEDVVVIVGSGAGGGTLANELCQKGVKVVVLEAGRHHTPDDFVNDEWRSFKQLAWLDKRTTSGSFRVARDFPKLPAWTCKTVGGTTVHWAGCCPRFMPHEFKAIDLLRRHGRGERARLADLLRRRRALLRPGRGEAGDHADARHPADAGEQQLQGVRQRRASASATSASTPAATPSTRCRATAGRRRSRTASPSRATRSAPSGRRSSPSCPRRRRPGSSTCAPSRTSSASSTTTRASPRA